eukprot:SAG31_NODE_1391_length_8535_cov_11.998696_8_plen_146_part_00
MRSVFCRVHIPARHRSDSDAFRFAILTSKTINYLLVADSFCAPSLIAMFGTKGIPRRRHRVRVVESTHLWSARGVPTINCSHQRAWRSRDIQCQYIPCCLSSRPGAALLRSSMHCCVGSFSSSGTLRSSAECMADEACYQPSRLC